MQISAWEQRCLESACSNHMEITCSQLLAENALTSHIFRFLNQTREDCSHFIFSGKRVICAWTASESSLLFDGMRGAVIAGSHLAANHCDLGGEKLGKCLGKILRRRVGCVLPSQSLKEAFKSA